MSTIILSKKAKPSQRQYEILMFRAMKMKYSEIAGRLSISKTGVRRHLDLLMARLCCISQSELIEFAKSQGWIQSCIKAGGEVEYRIKAYDQIQSVRVFKASL